MNKRFYLLFISLFLITTVFGQHEKAINSAKQFLQENIAEWQLTEADIADIAIENIVTSKHNGVTHIYFNQQYQGIKIFNALSTVNVLPNGKILHANNRFLPKVATLINTTQARITPEVAIQNTAGHLEIKAVANLRNKVSTGRNKVVYTNTNISNSNIIVEPIYQLMEDGKLHLAWQLAIDMAEKADYWNVRVDAQTGEIISKNNWTTHCSVGMHEHQQGCGFLERENKLITTAQTVSELMPTVDGSSYNVFALPIESPLHGNRSIVTEPAHPIASPFGWHDTDGQAGAEFTITRGNNAHAYSDIDDTNVSIGDEPDGGDNLVFDYPILEGEEPESNRNAATTQLFYLSNMMHDIFYTYGFDEQAGNFQATNYEFAFGDGDYVRAEAQDGYNNALANNPEYIGNANFTTPNDGSRPRMQMYVWGRGGGRLLQVTEPTEAIADYEVATANFGLQVIDLDQPIIGQAVVVDDGSFSNPTLGCEPLANAEEVNGKIAIIDRGTCFFSDKAANAQNAGAIAVLICNFEDALQPMGAAPGFQAGSLTIPVLGLRRNDCQIIRASIDNGLELRIENPPTTGPDFLDGDFDNGIVAHEYGHGISNRLNGGRSNTNCLFNDEAMGEGWSDFFTLVTTVKAGDTGAEKRGIGTYSLRQEVNSQGIRTFPYSTDMEIAAYTYKDIINISTAPHPVGAVWTAMLWDLYWAMADKYGWEEGFFNGDGGNHQAIQLVMDGLKIQPCSPGFIDGRDAILAADRANNGGANECLIWEVFSRRGLGFSATQGANDDRNDAIEAFDRSPSCIKALVLHKTATKNINAGEEIEYTLTLTNHKEESVTDVVLVDNLPEGLTFNSASVSATVGGGIIRFEVPELASGEEMEVTYTATADNTQTSTRQFLDDMEEGDAFWLIINEENTNLFSLQDGLANSGENAWHVINPEEADEDSEQFLQLDEEILITGEQPTLRFFHQYSIDEGTAGGIVEISTDGGSRWTDLGPYFFRNGYVRPLAYNTFALVDLEAFSGKNEAFEASYVDLSNFIGERVTIRFRFGSVQYDNENIPNKIYDGWFIDDVEFMDLQRYQSEACATTAEGDNVCAMAAEGGTVVEVGGLNTSVQDLEDLGLQFEVFPNPAGDYINISLRNEAAKEGVLSLFNMSGQTLLEQKVTINKSTQVIPINVEAIAAGFYVVKVQTNEGIAVKKIILE
ncbi:MAG: T9SS-dependent M36 family metallopeptidase [Saprospiraceae bacterium]